jgi:predicted lipid-binding transport protein (Tim44 family)
MLLLTMSKQLRALAILTSTALLAGPVAAPAGAALRTASPLAAKVAVTAPTQSRLGGSRGFGRRSPSIGSRRRVAPASRYRARRSPFRGLGGSILRALGIAYLVHMLFGWGAGGGSPFGLLLLLGIVALWFAMRRRRRYVPAGYRY